MAGLLTTWPSTAAYHRDRTAALGDPGHAFQGELYAIPVEAEQELVSIAPDTVDISATLVPVGSDLA